MKITIEQTLQIFMPKYGKIKNLKHGIFGTDLVYTIMNRIARNYECFRYYVMYNSYYVKCP